MHRYSLSRSSLSTKDKQSALMASENDLLQPNTGDIPLETINQQRKYTQYVYMFINILFLVQNK